MAAAEPNTDELLERAASGDGSATGQLLTRNRARLRRMVAVRMDPRLVKRLDPSDVVQEVLFEASQRMDEYLRRRPLAFYPWLRQLAWDHLVNQRNRHIRAQMRSVTREAVAEMGLSDNSVMQLAEKLFAADTGLSTRIVRNELRERVKAALARLSAQDREVLVQRYLEGLSVAEIAAIMECTEGAIKMRIVRALRRLRGILGERFMGSE